MFKIIGTDGKEYGPVSLEQLRRWLAEGRLTPQTKVQQAGSPDWKAANEIPELAALFTAKAGTPPAISLPPSGGGPAAGQQNGLAITSLVLGIFSLVTCILTGIPAIICGHIAYSRARRAPGQYGGGGMAIAGLVLGYVSLVLPFLLLPAMLLPALARAKERAQSINCANNMKMIGLSFKTWAIDHNDQYPFNVSTNSGGTMEFAMQGVDGFDGNAAIHFLSLSNELATPRVLVCPADSGKQAAAVFQGLTAANISYQLRTGTNITESTPQEVLVICPIHGHELRCDGSVEQKRGRVRKR